MTVQGHFTDQRQELKSFNNGEARLPERLIVIPMNLIRYLTRDSGFLYINSDERERYENFEPALFRMPNSGWAPPYPYCTKEVLFPFHNQAVDYKVVTEHRLLMEQLPVNDSLGG
jgi:hypothetical protein